MTRSPLDAFHVANALTYSSLVGGLGAIAAAAGGRASLTGALIAASVIADTLDGTFARLFTRSSDERALGAHLDSLADAITFGAAPAVCMMLLAPRPGSPSEPLLWIAIVMFAASAITRLAFFNVTHEFVDGFVGLPAPIAALIWSSSLLVHPAPATSAVVLVCLAAAMVLPFHLPRPRGIALALFALWPLAVTIAHTAVL